MSLHTEIRNGTTKAQHNSIQHKSIQHDTISELYSQYNTTHVHMSLKECGSGERERDEKTRGLTIGRKEEEQCILPK
jgi:hypothetical protein